MSDPGLLRGYDVPVVFQADPEETQLQSERVVDAKVCEAAKHPALVGAGVSTYGLTNNSGTLMQRFCVLTMPDKTDLPIVQVTRADTRNAETTAFLPRTVVVRATELTVTAPSGATNRLSAGYAEVLGWLPKPLIGCGPFEETGPSRCFAGFMRDQTASLTSGGGPNDSEALVLGHALGLRKIASGDTKPSDAAPVLAKFAVLDEVTLKRQLASVAAMIANPTIRSPDWNTQVIAAHQDVLSAHGEAIMRGLERAASVPSRRLGQTSECGRILAGLIAKLSDDRFTQFTPRLLKLYAGANREHWLWDTDDLPNRLGVRQPSARS